mmetsp:Transcript_32870/g.50985  ORF Transcript_32870/g.50985 Transcript_32870/m.50985 type:complete len:296 (+) Transcript_32870:42-929(+)
MSRIGLSIDDGSSVSCCSDLSESQASFSQWNEDADQIALRRLPERRISMSLDSGAHGQQTLRHGEPLSRSLPDMEIGQASLRTGSGYRSRIGRRLEDLQRRSDIVDDDAVECPGMISRQPQSRVRLYLALFSLCLVAYSSVSPVNASSRVIPTDIRRQEVVFPLHQQLHRPDQKQELVAELPKYYFPKAEPAHVMPASPDAKISDKPKPRANIAMARSQVENRPVFGVKQDIAAPDRNVKRFVLDDTRLLNDRNEKRGPSLTSWLAGISLICILIETGYKEYRRCQTSHDEERRL